MPRKEHKFPKENPITFRLNAVLAYLEPRRIPFGRLTEVDKEKWRDRDPILRKIKELQEVLSEFVR